MSTNNNNSLKGFPKSTSSPSFQNNGSANCGAYAGGGGGYQSGDAGGYNSYESSGSNGSYQNGPPSANMTFADKKKMENSSRPADLRPSEGGRYSGFGYSVDPQPKDSSNEVLDQALSSLTKGWSMFSLAATKIASR